MAKYLALSFFINLLLFSLYSYWVGSALQNSFKETFRYLPPLEISVKTQKVKFEDLKRQKVEKRGLKATQSSNKGIKSRTKERKVSLLASLSEEVKKEFRPILSKVKRKASAKISSSGKVEVNFSRKLLYIPKIEPIVVSNPPAPAVVKVVVLPDGRVIDAVLIKKSGNALLDERLLNFSKNLRFEPINVPVIQEIYIEYSYSML